MTNFTEQFSHFYIFKNSEYGLKVYLFLNKKIWNYELLASHITSTTGVYRASGQVVLQETWRYSVQRHMFEPQSGPTSHEEYVVNQNQRRAVDQTGECRWHLLFMWFASLLLAVGDSVSGTKTYTKIWYEVCLRADSLTAAVFAI